MISPFGSDSRLGEAPVIKRHLDYKGTNQLVSEDFVLTRTRKTESMDWVLVHCALRGILEGYAIKTT